MVRVCLFISEEDLSLFKKYCKLEELKLSPLMRKATREYILKHPPEKKSKITWKCF